MITKPVEKVTLPLTSTMLIGIAGDGGNGNNSAGFDTNLYIYTTATVYPTGIAFIAICKETVGKRKYITSDYSRISHSLHKSSVFYSSRARSWLYK